MKRSSRAFRQLAWRFGGLGSGERFPPRFFPLRLAGGFRLLIGVAAGAEDEVDAEDRGVEIDDEREDVHDEFEEKRDDDE